MKHKTIPIYEEGDRVQFVWDGHPDNGKLGTVAPLDHGAPTIRAFSLDGRFRFVAWDGSEVMGIVSTDNLQPVERAFEGRVQ